MVDVYLPHLLDDLGANRTNSSTDTSEKTDQSTVRAKGAFEDANYINAIYIPSTVTNVGINAFKNSTELKKITIDTTVTGVSMFEGCTGLINANNDLISMPTIKIISASMFKNCSNLINYEIPATVYQIGD